MSDLYKITDTAEGTRIALSRADAVIPAVWQIFLANGATNRANGSWTVSLERVPELTAALDAWAAEGKPSRGIPAGTTGGFTITHKVQGFYSVAAPRNFAPALKRLDGHWDSLNEVFLVPASAEAKLQMLIAKATKDRDAAVELKWPTIAGVDVTVRQNGIVAVKSPFDPVIKARIKAVPTARWDATARVWTISARYKAALHRALVGVADVAVAAVDRDAAAMASIVDRIAKLAAVKVVLIGEHSVQVSGPRDAELNGLCRASHLRWDGEVRAFTGKTGIIALGRLLDALEPIDQRITTAKPKAPSAVPVTRRSEPREELPSFLHLDGRFRVGDVVRLTRAVVVVTSLSRPFKDEDIGSIGGQPGWEDDWVVRVFYRSATEDEIAGLEEQEAQAEAKVAAVRAARAAGAVAS